ncbi:MAG: DUF4430 domain-containing protein [Lachnospiraceae bacterium]|jgi:hypothetical protein|nr:DUF4430 domain-containing protein [Lachnospiraceae bacterium]MEE3461189.1 DUF4430 domain-containing protein [Lachnospiraceae bacterium]
MPSKWKKFRKYVIIGILCLAALFAIKNVRVTSVKTHEKEQTALNQGLGDDGIKINGTVGNNVFNFPEGGGSAYIEDGQQTDSGRESNVKAEDKGKAEDKDAAEDKVTTEDKDGAEDNGLTFDRASQGGKSADKASDRDSDKISPKNNDNDISGKSDGISKNGEKAADKRRHNNGHTNSEGSSGRNTKGSPDDIIDVINGNSEGQSEEKAVGQSAGNTVGQSEGKAGEQSAGSTDVQSQANADAHSSAAGQSTVVENPENKSQAAENKSGFAHQDTGSGKDGEAAAKEVNCTITITCTKISSRQDLVPEGVRKYVPDSGVILANTSVTAESSKTVYDVLNAVCKAAGIAVDATFSPTYNTFYVRGINHIYEKAAGGTSGWMYSVNGRAPMVGASACKVKEGDAIEWWYTIPADA